MGRMTVDGQGSQNSPSAANKYPNGKLPKPQRDTYDPVGGDEKRGGHHQPS